MIRIFLRFIGIPVHAYRYDNPYSRRCIYCNKHKCVYQNHNNRKLWEDMVSKKRVSKCLEVDK